ncbi:MAG: short-chain dehydrogenase [Fusobacteria bacterium]|nr:MAG: short-chain dehydrogenase [Fusobacteriota bacterium]KAF0230204.1 MAG: short-chain [Fusobacteriota bacterium]
MDIDRNVNKNVVITGSTNGIGLEMAIEFLKAGCNVTISGRKPEISSELAERLEVYKEQYIYIQCDVRILSDIQNLWNLALSKWSTIDIWINNAGVNVPYKNIWETESCYLENVVNTNILGMIYGSQIAAKNMQKQKKGAIYSMEGLGSNNMWQVKTILYGTTKHALTYFMKGLAKELKGSEVIVGRLYPGMMLTDFITKGPDGKEAETMDNISFKKIFNILGDKPDKVAKYIVPRILANKKNDARISWLTTSKIIGRFLSAPFKKRKLL